jgi:teichuronic acid biosynthesis glycosyltransferase TuaC
MKILHITPLNSKSEIPIFIKRQIEYLDKHDLINEVYGFQGHELLITRLLVFFNSIRDLYKALQKSEAKVIHAHWGSILGLIVVILNAKSKKTILSVRGSDINRSLDDSILLNFFRKFFTILAAIGADKIIVMSKQIENKLFFVRHKITIIPDGTPVNIFYPYDQNKVKKELNLVENKKYVIFHCGGRPISKNLELASKIFAKIKVEIQNAELIVLEDDKSQNEVAKLLSASDLLLFTSRNEGSPNIVREAIACGCPVVSTRVADVEKWIEKSGAGAVMDSDYILMAEASVRIIKMGTRSKSEAIKEATSEAVNLKVIKEYKRIVDVENCK